MPLSLQQIRSFSGTGAVVLQQDANGGQRLSEAGFGHRLKSFFGVSAAADENRRTLDAVRDAIRNDPRYSSADVLRRADELLREAVGDGKAVSADRIRSVVDRLDEMTDPASRRAAFDGLVAGRLAARGIPGFARGNGEAWRQLATRFLAARAPAVADSGPGSGTIPDYGSVDVAGGLADFEDLMQRLADRMPGRDAALSSLLRRAPELFVDGSTDRLLPAGELEDLVDRFRDAFDAVETAAAAHGLPVAPLLAALERTGARPPAPDEAAALVAAGAAAANALRGLGPDSDASAIHAALAGLLRASGARTPEARTLCAAAALAGLPMDAHSRIFAAMQGRAGRNLLAFYEHKAFGNPPVAEARALAETAFSLYERLRAASAPAPFAPLLRPLSAAPSLDPAAIPPDVRAHFSSVPGLSESFDSVGLRFLENDEADGYTLKRAMDESATNQLQVSVAKFMKLETDDPEDNDGPFPQFFHDLHRSADEAFHLEGERLPFDNDIRAFDMLERFLEDGAGPDEPPLRKKAAVLMACVNQSLIAIGLTTLGEAFAPGHGKALLAFGTEETNATTDATRRTSDYRISKDPANGDILVAYEFHQPVGSMIHREGTGAPRQFPFGRGSFWHATVRVRLPRADLVRLAGHDWGNLDFRTIQGTDRAGGFANHAEAARELSKSVPFGGSVHVDFRLHHVPPPPPGPSAAGSGRNRT